jgi:hypothetical protein
MVQRLVTDSSRKEGLAEVSPQSASCIIEQHASNFFTSKRELGCFADVGHWSNIILHIVAIFSCNKAEIALLSGPRIRQAQRQAAPLTGRVLSLIEHSSVG